MTRNRRITAIWVIPAAFLLLLLPALSSASVFFAENRYFVPPGDTVNDDVYAAVSEVAVDGVITGDAFFACQKYSVSGDILGSLNSGSQYATVRGNVGGSARIFAQTIIIDAAIERNLVAFGEDIDLSEASRVGKDVTIMGGRVSLSGEIDGNAEVHCNELFISGVINGDLKIEAQKISILPPAEIAGNITYKSKNEISISDGVNVGGEVEWNEITPEEEKGEGGGINVGFRVLLFLASFVTGLLLIGLINRHTRAASAQITLKPLVSLGVGFVSFCAIPIAIVVLLVTLIGIPAAVILLFAYTVFFYIAKIYVSIALGRMILRALRKDADPKQGWSLLLGLVILTLLFMIPVLGTLVYLLVIFWGFGAVLLGIRECRWSPQPSIPTAPEPPPPPASA